MAMNSRHPTFVRVEPSLEIGRFFSAMSESAGGEAADSGILLLRDIILRLFKPGCGTLKALLLSSTERVLKHK